jgi:hypothetical protein
MTELSDAVRTLFDGPHVGTMLPNGGPSYG